MRMNFSRPQERKPNFLRNKTHCNVSDTLFHFQKIKQSAFKIRFDSKIMTIYKNFEKNILDDEENSEKKPKPVVSCQDLPTTKEKKKLHRLKSMNDLVISKENDRLIKLELEKKASFEEFHSENTLGKIAPDKKSKNSNHNLQNLIHEQNKYWLNKEGEESLESQPSFRGQKHEEFKKNEGFYHNNANANNVTISNFFKLNSKNDDGLPVLSLKRIFTNNDLGNFQSNMTKSIEEEKGYQEELPQKEKNKDKEMITSITKHSEIEKKDKDKEMLSSITKHFESDKFDKTEKKNEMPLSSFARNSKLSSVKTIALNEKPSPRVSLNEKLEKIENNENKKNLFWFDFETVKIYKNYFNEGNSKDIDFKRKAKRRFAVKLSLYNNNKGIKGNMGNM